MEFKRSLFFAGLYIKTSDAADPYNLGLLDPDPDPDPLVRGMDPDPDPSIIKQK